MVTDGGPDETGYLASIDPKTWERKTLLNNYYERPFIGFNEIEMDSEGNYYLTDSLSDWVRIFSADSPAHLHPRYSGIYRSTLLTNSTTGA